MLYPNAENKTDSDSNLNLFAENESSSTMSTARDDLILHPDDGDMEFEQSEQREAPETIAAIAASNLMPAHVTKMSENQEIRQLQAKVEELVQSKLDSDQRLAYAERQISEQMKEFIAMKRRRLDSAGNSVPTSSSARSSSSSGYRDQDYSCNQEEAHQSTLPIKGRLREELPEELKDPQHSYNWRKQSNSSPLKRAKIIPKLKSMGMDDYIVEGMPVNDLMDCICLISGLLYNTGASSQIPEWVPAEYLTCPPSIAMQKIEALTPAGYFNILRRPHFLSKDRLGVDPKAYYTPDHLPSNEHPVQLIMECRGRYEDYRFGTRKAVSTAKDRRGNMGSHLTPPHTPSKPSSRTDDLRNFLPPRKDQPDLRNSLRKKSSSETSSVPSSTSNPPATLPAKKEVKMVLVPVDPNYRGPGSFSGKGEMDIREREKVKEARRNEKEAEEALKHQIAVRKAAEEEEAMKAEEKIKSLTAYRDALMKGGGHSSGSRSTMSSHKRTRAPTPTRSPSPSPAPSSSRTPSLSGRKRITARSGKGKDRRRSYSRSPSKGSFQREHRPSQKSVPGLYIGQEEARAATRRREFTPRSPAPRRRSPSTPPRSPEWQDVTRRRRERR
jgi:hypothetical protein